jgi:DNA-binding transcriptional LysR family regulator
VTQVAPALGVIRESIEAVNRHRASPTGLLRLNVSVGAAQQILAPIIFEYLRRYPEMSVDIVTEDRLVDIVKDGFDAGVRLGEHLPGDMIAVPLGPEQRLIVVGSPAYFQGRAYPQTPQELQAHECIRRRLASGTIYRWEFERRGKKIDVDVAGRMTLDRTDLMQEAAVAGLGLAYLSVWQVASDVKAGRLVQVLAEWTPPFSGTQPLLSRSSARAFDSSRPNRSRPRIGVAHILNSGTAKSLGLTVPPSILIRANEVIE